MWKTSSFRRSSCRSVHVSEPYNKMDSIQVWLVQTKFCLQLKPGLSPDFYSMLKSCNRPSALCEAVCYLLDKAGSSSGVVSSSSISLVIVAVTFHILCSLFVTLTSIGHHLRSLGCHLILSQLPLHTASRQKINRTNEWVLDKTGRFVQDISGGFPGLLWRVFITFQEVV